MHKRPLPRVGGSGEHHEISQGGSSRHGMVIGPYCWCLQYFRKTFSYFGTIASFNVLMQNFYKITQRSSKKVPSFATRLEGTLNHIRLRCPGQIANCEVPWHLKEQLFHGVRKHARDSIRYLYGDPETTYSELVVAA